MNKVILMGRLTRDPEVRYSQGENGSAVARFSLAVDRRFKRAGDAEADFFNCTAFGRQAEMARRSTACRSSLRNWNLLRARQQQAAMMRVIISLQTDLHRPLQLAMAS